MAGRPKGSPNKHGNKLFRDALRMKLVAKDHEKLGAIAQALIDKATKGDMEAIREIAERIDGKPAPVVEVDDGFAMTHEEALEHLK